MKLPKRLNSDNLDSDIIQERIIARAITAAGLYLDENPEPLVQSAEDVEPSGATFTIPVVIPEDTFSGDGRIFNKNSITTRELPLPLMWQINTGPGHDGAVIAGRIDSIERVSNGLGNARGVFDVGAYGREAERLVRNKFLRGVSGDFDNFEASIESPEETFEVSDPEEAVKKAKEIKSDTIRVTGARLMGATLVAKPAFQECFILLDDEAIVSPEILPDGIYDDINAEPESVIVASAIPVNPPHAWFSNPDLSGPTALTVDDDGRVYGHLATWSTSHISMAGQVRPPRSSSDYQYFRSGVVRTDDGTDVTVGQLTLTHGHADINLNAASAKAHYDSTESAVVDVVAGEDQFGIWLAGALRPDVTPAQIRALRASGISGDWRPINGRLELVAACCVNVAGFPTVRTMVASGQTQALVAAGTADLVHMKRDQLLGLEELNSRFSTVEQFVLRQRAAELSEKMAPFIEEANFSLQKRADRARRMME